LERYFSIVRNSRNWTKTELKVIYKAVNAILEHFQTSTNNHPDLLDWQVEFQLFPDYAYSINAFITHLEVEKKIPDAEYSEAILGMAEDDLNEKAAVLGKYVLDSKEYFWLKSRDKRLRELERKSSGYPLSLC
jgi:hypothetical protein